ncbi:MAG: RluA family pseudouridine synthase [Clostridia bacterium]|nr:RluA family pseudouridine synthase [Clostridia bacterium]
MIVRILTYTAGEADEGRAVRSVVPRRFQLGQHAFRRLKVLEAIRVNDQVVRADHILHAGDVIRIFIPSDMPSEESASPSSDASLPPSFIRYQDEDIIIVSKGAPLPTLPASHITSGTLREQLIDMLHADAASFVYHPVNRLDKGTSGLLCIARHAHAQRLMTQQLHTNRFIREYLAVSEGIPAENEGVIDAPVARLGTGARRAVRSDGQHAMTHYRVVQTCGSRALIRLRLETGRTHQIRVHLAHIGCPIAGDYLYGTELEQLPGRFALHSAFISLRQPITGEMIRLEEPLPAALGALLDKTE